jgi:hypothetical protein
MLFKTLSPVKNYAAAVALAACLTPALHAGAASEAPPPAAADAAPTSAPEGWRAYNRAAVLKDEGGRQIIHVDGRPHEGIIWLRGSDLKDGTIGVDLRGKNITAHSALGVTFRGVDDTHYDAVYFRPFNFTTEVPMRRLRMVQYISMPDNPWLKLRKGTPGKYEKPVSPVPDPDGWFHARIVIEGQTVSVYVNDSNDPSLAVTTLSEPRGGMVGLFVEYGSEGDFANFTVTPKQ